MCMFAVDPYFMRFFLLLLYSLVLQNLRAQTNSQPAQRHTAILAFWNVENLFDTLDDPFKTDEDFTPNGKLNWNTSRYRAKLRNLSETIARIALPDSSAPLVLLGLCEVENREVVRDLIAQRELRNRHYGIVHRNSRDQRGIDPALVYDSLVFVPSVIRAYNYVLPSDSARRTRHILLVLGRLWNEPVAVLVNHWPSRRGGERASRAARLAAAAAVTHIADSLAVAQPDIKLIVMGDFNDDPDSRSIKQGLSTFATRQVVSGRRFYNPMEALHQQGLGTLAFRDRWNLFDQILFSPNWLLGRGLQYAGAGICNGIRLQTREGRYRGYPLRTYSGTVYTGGYSDHFPVYAIIVH